jgi:hypothetical protein
VNVPGIEQLFLGFHVRLLGYLRWGTKSPSWIQVESSNEGDNTILPQSHKDTKKAWPCDFVAKNLSENLFEADHSPPLD